MPEARPIRTNAKERSMKLAIILPDGAADEPLPKLGGRTPLEAADIPNMDWIASHGRLGRVVTVPNGFVAGTDVATLSLLGYDPHVSYTGRAPIEAAAQGISLQPDEIVFRCNFVTILEGRMLDFTAHHIQQDETEALIAALNAHFGDEPLLFHAGVSYRNLLVAGDNLGEKAHCTPPHDIPNQLVEQHLPAGAGANRLRDIMTAAAGVLRHHEVNRRRASTGMPPVTDIWLWGQGRPRPLQSFADRWGLHGAVITGVDIIRGLAVSAGLELIEVPGATGYVDTNYAGKGQAAADALRSNDIIITHVEASDEAGHLGDADLKVETLEQIDRHVVGRVLDAIRRFDDWRILVAPDHPTPVSTKAHSGVPPPFCYAGPGVPPAGRPFSERAAAETGDLIDPGHTLMAQFLGR